MTFFESLLATRIPVLKIEKAGILLLAGKLLYRFERIRDRAKRIFSYAGFLSGGI